ncbi:hypothetical protein B7463_g10566, partial [Scytalidium lignicola]
MKGSTPFTPCRIATAFLVISISMIITFQSQLTAALKATRHSTHEQVDLAHSKQYHLRTFPDVTPLEDLGSEGDKAWDTLTTERGGFLWIQYNETYDIPWGISMFHGLHCLQMLRREFQSQLGINSSGGHHHHKRNIATKHENHGNGVDTVHLGHCLAYIAEMLECVGDSTIEAPWIKVDKMTGNMIDHGIDGAGVQHQCRDISRLHVIAEETEQRAAHGVQFPRYDMALTQDENERTALLHANAFQPLTSPSPSIPKLKLKWITWILVGTLVLAFETGNAMRVAPLIASYEEILCVDATQPNLKPSRTCLNDHAVKNELAVILGVSQFLDCVPALLLSGLYGSMADKHGRRPVLLLGYLGMILSAIWMTAVIWLAPRVPLRLVWVGPLFTIIGGGSSVPISILMTTATDIVPSTQRVSVFSFIHGTALLAVIVGSAISSVMMTSLGNHLPLLIGLSLMCLALLLSFLLPVTGQKSRHFSTTSTGHSIPRSVDPLTSSKRYTVWKTRGAIPIMIAGFLSMLGQQVQILILQYMPEVFGISLAQANIFNVLNNSVNLFMLFLILPFASKLLLRYYGPFTFSKDLALAHISGFLFAAGALVLSIASNVTVAVIGEHSKFCLLLYMFAHTKTGIIIFGTGIGLSSVLRSIFVELFPPERAAFATTLISAAKAVGGSFSGPIYSYAFSLSLDLRGILQGLPFLVSAACFAIVELLLITARLKSDERSG